MMSDPSTACSKMPETWKVIDTEMSAESMAIMEQMGYEVYKEMWNRYNASGLNVTWEPYMCEAPVYNYTGCYTNSSDGARYNYMLSLNATCAPSASLGMTADASYWGNMTYVYDVDLEYMWMDGEMTMGEKPSVWWEKNDEYWHMDEGGDDMSPDMDEDDEPMMPPAVMAPPAGGY